MKFNDILNLNSVDINKLSKPELTKITQQTVHIVKTRARRLEARGLTNSPAYKSFKQVESMLNTKGKTLNELRQTFKEARYQAGLKTSTVKGYKQLESNIKERLGDFNGVDVNLFWKVYNKYQEAYDTNFKAMGDSDKVQKILYQIMQESKKPNFDELMKIFDDKIKKMYEEKIDDILKDFEKNLNLDDIF